VTPILALYAITGFTGLLAEQGYERYMALLVGATASASAVVLFTYFLGFAAGSLIAARLLNRGLIRRPLLAYALVEGLAGASCVIFSYSFPALTALLTPIQSLAASPQMQFPIRFLFGCLLVFPTATLMGASFPLIAAALDSNAASHTKRWPQAYCANLAGALAAALATPFAILPLAGVRGALWICCSANALVAVGAVVLSGRLIIRRPAAVRARTTSVRSIRLLLAASFASGAIFFALEVIWTHLIGVVIGCSVYAFSWMLTAILAGLLLGAGIAGRRGQAIRTSVLFQTAALLMAGQIIFWDFAPAAFGITPPALVAESFYFAEIYKLGLAALLLVPPAAVLGLIYPRLLASPLLEGESNSHLAGYLNAANSLGCLYGALLGIFVLLPRAGSELSLKIIVLLLALFWILFLRRESTDRPRLLRIAAVVATLLVVIGIWHWNWPRLTSGAGNYFGQRPTAQASASDVKAGPAAIVFGDESVQGGITTVVEQSFTKAGKRKTLRVLLTNGKFQGDDNEQATAQFGFAAVPSLFVSGFARALLIGLGTGHSAATLRRAGYRDIDIAEYSPGIVRAAAECFGRLNESILGSPGVHLRLEDGRNVLLADTRTRYDLITVEISSVWFAGATNLYSREFYELAKTRLAPHGVLQQWVQFHHISPRELSAQLATVRAVFPYVGLWYYGSQGMMVASDRPLTTTDARRACLTGRFSQPDLAAELEAARVLDPRGVDQLVRENRPNIITDHNRWIEYASPRYAPSSYDWVTHNLRFLSQYRQLSSTSP
jgi:spermidine synthase